MLDINWDNKKVLAPGIIKYSNVLKPELNLISRLEEILAEDTNPYEWRGALVGYNQSIPSHRDCWDFKPNEELAKSDIYTNGELESLWQDCYDAQNTPVQDYRTHYGVQEIRFWECMNFIKYGPGQHFKEHHDHGSTYNCVVSLVAYLNDDYEGGELYFRTWDLTIKPKTGDLLVFPSNYMYPHTAMPVTSGTKYSIATMLDYSAKYHQPDFYQETGM